MSKQEDQLKKRRLEMLMDACNESLDKTRKTSSVTDYFLRLTTIVPEDEVELHRRVSMDCECKPTVERDEANCWRTIIHNVILTEEQIKEDFEDVTDTLKKLDQIIPEGLDNILFDEVQK